MDVTTKDVGEPGNRGLLNRVASVMVMSCGGTWPMVRWMKSFGYPPKQRYNQMSVFKATLCLAL